jgi:hypothetical protein
MKDFEIDKKTLIRIFVKKDLVQIALMQKNFKNKYDKDLCTIMFA